MNHIQEFLNRIIITPSVSFDRKRLLRFSFLFIIFISSATLSAQRITRNYNNVSLSEALRQLSERSKRYRISFLYNELEDFRVTTSVSNKTIPDAIRQIIGFYPVRMTIVGDSDIYIECTHKTDFHLTGKVLDENSQPIAYANVALLNPSDSTLLTGGVTNESGVFVIPSEQTTVIARISYVGYKTFYRRFNHENVGIIKMQPDTYALKGVTVKGHHNIIKPFADGFNVSIENSPLSGIGYASDVLKYLPFVNAKNEEYEIVGKGKPLIYLNNRIVRDYSELRQINSSELKSVKIITNPGAEYDAAVNSVIRITTLKPVGDGFSGILDANIEVERKTSAILGGSINYRKAGLDLFGSFRYSLYKWVANQIGEYQYSDRTMSERVRLESNVPTYRPTIGFNYQWENKSSIGMRYQYTLSPDRLFNCYNSFDAYKQNKKINSQTSTDNRKNDNKSHHVNAYADYIFNEDTHLKLDLDYYNGNTIHRQSVNIAEQNLNTHNKSDNILYAGRLSFEMPIFKGELKTGMEVSYTNNDNKYNVLENSTLQNALSSTTNKARQHLYAGYMQYSRSFSEKLNATLGARYEYSDFNYYIDEAKSAEVSKSYSGFFPSASIAYNVGKVKMSLAYRYSTERPDYFSLRNAIDMNSPYSYEAGNPKLLPSKTNMLTYSIMWKDLMVMASYSDVKDGIIFVYDRFENSDSINFFQARNISRYHSLNIALHYSPTLLNIWKPKMTLEYSKPYITYNSVGYRKPELKLKMNNIIELSSSLKLGLDIIYNTAGNSANDISYDYADFCTEIYCVKTFNEKLRLNFSVYNVFNTSREKWKLKGNGIVFGKWNDGNRRSIELMVTYRFNQSKSKYKGTSSTSELNRL